MSPGISVYSFSLFHVFTFYVIMFAFTLLIIVSSKGVTMTPIQIYILDDSVAFLQQFTNYLSTYLTRTNLFPYTLSTFTDAKSMLAAAKVDNVKLLIADIALGTSHYSGIDAVNDLHRTHPQCSVIYLSAYTSYALDVFDTKPLYFIFKEEYKERLPHAMELFFHAYLEQYQYISLARNSKPYTICLNDLVYCEHSNRVTRLILLNSEHSTYAPIQRIFELLPKNRFALCHKSFIVNFKYVFTYTRHTITLADHTELPMSRSFCDEFRTKYNSWICEYATT